MSCQGSTKEKKRKPLESKLGAFNGGGMEGNGNTTAQARKRKAIELLKQLQLLQPYVRAFEENDLVCFFEDFIGFWAFQDPELEAKVKEIEQNYNCTVYAITHEFTFFGECYKRQPQRYTLKTERLKIL